MRGVICCAAALLAVLAATAGGATAARGGLHVTVVHPQPGAAASVTVPSDLAATPVEVRTAAGSVRFRLRGAHGHGVDALPGTDVAYTATAGGARELLTLKSPAAPLAFTYDLQLTAGVSPVQLGPRTVVFVAAGKPIAMFVAPAMTDAAGAVSRALTVTLGHDSLTVTPDAAWLAAAAYPIVVDPDVLTLTGAPQDTYIESGSPDGHFAGDPQLLVGYDAPATGTPQAIRGLLNFQLDMSIPAGATIDSAQLSLHLESAKDAATTNVTVANVVDPWAGATWNQYDWDYQTASPLLWNTPGGDVDTVGAATASVVPTPGSTATWDVTQLVQRQVAGLVPSYGFELWEQGESTDQVLAFTSDYASDGNPPPTLTVTWEDPTTSSTGPAVSLVPSNSIMFGSQPVGVTTPTQEVDVENTGAAPLNVGSLAIGGANASDFAIAKQTCTGSAVQPGGTCAVTLTATPGAVGNRYGTLTITDDAPNSPQNVALQVNGTGSPAASVSPSSLSFGTVKVNQTSVTQYVTVTSTGQGSLTVSKVSRSGKNAGDFSVVSDGCTGTQLAPGSSCSIGVRARPKSRGTRTATLVIADNATGGGTSVPLSVVGG